MLRGVLVVWERGPVWIVLYIETQWPRGGKKLAFEVPPPHLPGSLLLTVTDVSSHSHIIMAFGPFFGPREVDIIIIVASI